MPKKRDDLSKTEWTVMKICWETGEATARMVYEETLKQKQRGYQTVKTMLDRLVEKGYLQRKKLGPIWLYKPVVSRAAVTARTIDSFANTVLDNTLAPILAHFAKREDISQAEVNALKSLLASKKKG